MKLQWTEYNPDPIRCNPYWKASTVDGVNRVFYYTIFCNPNSHEYIGPSYTIKINGRLCKGRSYPSLEKAQEAAQEHCDRRDYISHPDQIISPSTKMKSTLPMAATQEELA